MQDYHRKLISEKCNQRRKLCALLHSQHNLTMRRVAQFGSFCFIHLVANFRLQMRLINLASMLVGERKFAVEFKILVVTFSKFYLIEVPIVFIRY